MDTDLITDEIDSRIDSVAVINDLRMTVLGLGIEFLTTLFNLAPSVDMEHDPIMLEQHLELLKTLVQAENPCVTFDLESSSADDYVYVALNSTNDDDYLDVAETSPYYSEQKEKKDDTEVATGPTSTPDEVEISKEVFPELFPVKEVTKKITLQKSFPNIDEFDGGVHRLSSGNFGLTFKSMLRGVPVVLKVSKRRSEESNRADYHEWSISERLKPHTNVLQVIGLCPSFRHPMYPGVGTTALIVPLQENGGLRDFYDNREVRDGDILDIAFGMIVGIRSLHEQRVVHRDIAVRNFLVDSDGRVLLCDFGLTEFIPEGRDVFHGLTSESLPWRNLAPESFDLVFSTKSDIWMYGLALLELDSKQRPWSNMKTFGDLKKALTEKEFALPDMENLPVVIADIVRDCLKFDPSDRPSANDIAERLVKSQFEEVEGTRDENWDTYFHRIVKIDEYQTVKKYVASDKPTNINSVNIFSKTPLMMANTDSVRSLILSYRPIPHCNTEPSRIPMYFHNIDLLGTIHRLAQNEDVDTIKSLGSLEFDRNDYVEQMTNQVRYPKGASPLHVAAKIGSDKLFDALLNLNIFDVWKTNDDGQTVLHVASANGHVVLLEKLMLLEKHVDLMPGTADKDIAVVNIQDDAGKTALHLATLHGQVDTTKTLLMNISTDVNVPDIQHQTALFDCVSGARENPDYLAHILQNMLAHPSVDINATNSNHETVLHKAVREESTEAVEILLRREDLKIASQEREHGSTPLHMAIRGLSDDIVKCILARGDVNVNQTDKYGNVPLYTLAKVRSLPSGKTRGDSTSQDKRLKIIATMLLTRNDIEVNKAGAFQKTPLHVAAEMNNVILAEKLLSRPDIDVNAQNSSPDGDTPLHCAARENNVKIASLLLQRDDVVADAKNFRKFTPLHFASYYKSFEIANTLLSRNDVDANAQDEKQSTPLHKAAFSNSIEIAKLLLSRDDVDINAQNNVRIRPLHFAASKNSVEVAKLLLARCDVDVNVRGSSLDSTPLHLTANSNSVAIAKLLFSRDDLDLHIRDKKQRTPLHRAAYHKSVDAAKYFLSREDVDVNARDEELETPLLTAARRNCFEIAELLLSRDDVDFHARDDLQRTLLHFAACYNNVELTNFLLLRDDFDVNARDLGYSTPMHTAAETNNVEIVKLLLSKVKVDINAQDLEQMTPLHHAVFKNSVEVVKLLLSRGDADLNARCLKHNTPLHHAMYKNSVEVATLLLSRSEVDINARNKNRRTPLHVAVECSNFECMKLLLSRGDVDIKARDELQHTPLLTAARVNCFKGVKILLTRDDVDLHVRDKYQQTLLHFAAYNNGVELAKFLLSRDDFDLNARSTRHSTPLHDAMYKNSVDVAKLLLSRDEVDVNARDEDQRTPLHITVDKLSFDCAKLLLSRGDIDIHARDVHDKTALDLAQDKSASEYTKLLQGSN